MEDIREYAFVLNAEGKRLAPMVANKAWYQIRKGKASLISRYPLVVRLRKTIPEDEICCDEIRLGIDDGSKHVGLALVQKCRTKDKVVFKATIEHRNDVHKLMELRKAYRRDRRAEKRHRKARPLNRIASRRKGRLAPSILQKRQAVMRAVNQLRRWVRIDSYWLEDVAMDVRAMTDGYRPYRWQYQKSNRLDGNLRRAALVRDGFRCRECGSSGTVLEVHHIRPRRDGGPDTISNLISLCHTCHDSIKGNEAQHMRRYYDLIGNSLCTGLNYAMHVMLGKQWLRTELAKLGPLHLTTGGDTANRRMDLGIGKSHANDAICVTGSAPDTTAVKEYAVKPMRRQSKAKTDSVLGIRHRDLVEYTYRNGETHRGYVTALYPTLGALNFQSPTKHCKKVNARKCRLIWHFDKIYWLEDCAS